MEQYEGNVTYSIEANVTFGNVTYSIEANYESDYSIEANVTFRNKYCWQLVLRSNQVVKPEWRGKAS